ncbi:hypothetical protein RUM43_006304 [Polyplax serrata]|uniref:Uncharacterized protein n=1 Tax=Polyplax serrata TaxID=468196 RepID=A0AAN8PCG7_POLSC
MNRTKIRRFERYSVDHLVSIFLLLSLAVHFVLFDILTDICSGMIYQPSQKRFTLRVFVYTSQIYVRIKEKLKSKGVTDLSNAELSAYFSPWYAEHIGEIQSASGNSSVQAWAAQNLRIQFYFFSYPSVLKLHGNMDLLRALNSLLGNEAMLSLDLKTIAPVFKDPAKRKWFIEVIDNHLKLWESNM